MSVDTIIEGVSRKDETEMNRMLSVEVACEEANIKVPDEVIAYLELDHSVVSKLRAGIDRGVSIETMEGLEEIEIDLSKIDSKIDIIRITKTW